MSGEGKGGSSDEISRWEVTGERVVANCAIFDLIARRFRHPKRETEDDFYVLQTRDWVIVLPLTKSGEIVMVRQFRFGVEEFSWEIPGGVMDRGDGDPLKAGLRELREETGYVAESARILGKVAPNPAILDNRCHFVLAEDVTPDGEVEWDEHEELEVKLFPVEEIFAMVRRGEITHALVVAAFFHFYPEWERIKAGNER